MSKHFAFNPQFDFAIERFIDAPIHLVWEALTKPEHLAEWYMPKMWGRVVRAELELRPGGMFSIDIAVGEQEIPNLGCVLDVVPNERLVWTSMLFPGYRPAVFDDIPITAIMTMQPEGTGTRYVFTALHRSQADLETNKSSGFYQGTEIAIDQFSAHVLSLHQPVPHSDKPQEAAPEIALKTVATNSGTVPLSISNSCPRLRPRSTACCLSFASTTSGSARSTSTRNDCGCTAQIPQFAKCSGWKCRRLNVTLMSAPECTAAAAT